MSTRERNFVSLILLAIIVIVLVDLITDSREGVRWWHLLIEGGAALAAALGIFLLLKDTFRLRHHLEEERAQFSHYRIEAETWRANSKKYAEGLSRAIDDQLTSWKLTPSEKEVALLLLKGLSLKEVAEVRQTSEKTVRAQSLAIYAKSGLAGRSELAAFFLEDLLLPKES